MSTQAEKDDETKRRVSTSMQATAFAALAPIGTQIMQPPKSQSSPTPKGGGDCTTQVEKDEATKRRMSAARTERMEAAVASVSGRRPSTPPMYKDEIKPTSSSTSSPGSIPPTPDRLIVPAASSGDREALVKFPKSRQGYTPPRSPAITKSNNVISSTSNHSRRPSLPHMPSKAGLRISPKTLPHQPDASGSAAVKRPALSLPLLPVNETDNQLRKILPVHGDRQHRASLPPQVHQRLSLTEALGVRSLSVRSLSVRNASPTPATPATSPEKQVMVKHRLGDRKQRVSLPPQAASHSQPVSLTESFESTGSAALSVSSSPARIHRWGEKKQRASLPPAASPSPLMSLTESFESSGASSLPATSSPARKHRLGDKKQRVSLPPQAASPSQQMLLTESFESIGACSLPSLSTSSPGRKHRLGQRKQRVSLPSQSRLSPTLSTTTQAQPRLSLPLSIRLEAFPFPLPKKEDPEGHKKHLGEKKSQRISLPSAAVFMPALSSSSSDEEQTTKNNNSFDSSRRNSAPSGVPQKGLRNNSIHRRVSSPGQLVIPDISGPGAYFVPGGLVSDEGTFDNTEGDIEVGFNNEGPALQSSEEEEEIHLSAPFSVRGEEEEYHVGAAFSTIQEEDEHYISSNVIASRPTPSSSSSAGSTSGRNWSTAISVESSRGRGEDPKTGRWCGMYPWCCLLVVLLILAGTTVAVVMVMVNGHNVEKTPEGIVTLPPQTVSPSVKLFENGTVPDFTIAAWEDPDSPQSKAREWLMADPNAGNFSQNRIVQRFALTTLFYSTNGFRWKNSKNWLSYDHHECLWYSSLTGADTGGAAEIPPDKTGTSHPSKICNEEMEYEYLILASGSLGGPVPPELSLLTSLVQINLSNNRLQGQLPSEIGALSRLTDLSLSSNELDGTLPNELGRLSNLERLDLTTNKLAGALPPMLAGLRVLKDFLITNNALNSTIPTVLGKLTQLETLELGNNKLVGTIPSEIGLCGQLKVLNVGQNQLQRGLPTELWVLTNLTSLTLERNSLNYTLPSELGLLSNLNSLLAESSGLRGTIGTEIASLTNLGALDLGRNMLQYNIPTELGYLTKLEGLDLSHNQINGSLPSEVGNLDRLLVLKAFQNPIGGKLPSEIGRLTSLTEVQVFETMMSGALPSEIGNLSALKWLNFGDTSISGTIPALTCSLASSQQLQIRADCERANLVCCDE